MLGEENGVMARLKSEVPDLIMTHCAAHCIAQSVLTTKEQKAYMYM